MLLVSFWSIQLDRLISEKSKLSLVGISNVLLSFSRSIFFDKTTSVLCCSSITASLFQEKLFRLSFVNDPSLRSCRESLLIFFEFFLLSVTFAYLNKVVHFCRFTLCSYDTTFSFKFPPLLFPSIA